MAKGKYYTPEFKEQAVKMAVGLDCTYDLLHAFETDSPQASRSRHCRAGKPILSLLIPGCSVAGDQGPSRFPVRGPDAAEASGM